MDTNKRKVLQGLGLYLAGVVAGDIVIMPAVRWITPIAPVAIYNVAATMLALLMGIAMVWAIWKLVRTVWSFLTSKQPWKSLWKDIQEWPRNRDDALFAVEMAWLVALFATSVVFFTSVPEETFTSIAPLVAPIMVLLTLPALIPFTIQFGIALYRETKQQWVSGTRGTRIYLLTSAIIAAAAYLIILAGEFAGWEHRLWFSDA